MANEKEANWLAEEAAAWVKENELVLVSIPDVEAAVIEVDALANENDDGFEVATGAAEEDDGGFRKEKVDFASEDASALLKENAEGFDGSPPVVAGAGWPKEKLVELKRLGAFEAFVAEAELFEVAKFESALLKLKPDDCVVVVTALEFVEEMLLLLLSEGGFEVAIEVAANKLVLVPSDKFTGEVV